MDRGGYMELLIGGEFLSNTHLSLVNSKKDILLDSQDSLLDIPKDMYPFSVFGSG